MTQPSPSAVDQQLIAAAWKNDIAEVRRLIAVGADVNATDNTGQSAFLIAASEGYVDLLDLTLRHGADVASLDGYRGTALIRAAERGHAAVVGRLLRAGTTVDHVNRLGWTALLEAIILGDGSQRYVDTVRLLVAGGADLDRASVKDRATPLEHARSKGQRAVAATLQTRTPSSSAATTELLTAATEGSADRVTGAIRAGAALEARDDQRRTALLLAASNDRVDVARLLVSLGADPDAVDNRNDTPWLVTGVTGSVAMLETLLPARPDLTLRNRYGGISVIPASERGHVDYVRRVVRTGINVNHVNDLGWTALLEAILLGDGTAPYQQIVEILLDAGAKPGIADRDGITPLTHARGRGQHQIAEILKSHGAR
ncbi:ankyrin repeat domain-containing protein [Kribbella catacumbae]|uniref:ankyrin repeat domain-containing protein n=1 Tax=Kribbella catacumbae TaxID=460086 RepID=UPI00035EFBEE|nr:ankyrin repeat domain-containing protein [Kribbella catacumbae]